MKQISWADRLKYEEILNSVKDEINILHKMDSRKANWIGHILHRKYLLKYITKERYNDRKKRKKT
jgi:hypothetical protein